MAIANSPDGQPDPNAPRYANLPPEVLRQAIQIASDKLKTLRTTATSWALTVSGLVGISTILGLFKGSDAVAKLSVPTQILFAVSFFLALALAVATVYITALAAQGTPHDDDYGDISRILTNIDNDATDASNKLQTSRWLALVAVIFLALTIFFSLFDFFSSEPAGTTVLAVQRSGSVVCGKLTKAQAGQVSLTNNGQTITLNDVISLTVVPSCPSK